MKRFVFTSIFAGLVLGACGGGSDSKPKADPKVVAEAKHVWDSKCSTCHGADGSGAGPGSAALQTKPRSFNNPKWQAEVDNDRLEKVIVHGGTAVGLSQEMAPNPDLAAKPEVVQELVRIVRSFG